MNFKLISTLVFCCIISIYSNSQISKDKKSVFSTIERENGTSCLSNVKLIVTYTYNGFSVSNASDQTPVWIGDVATLSVEIPSSVQMYSMSWHISGDGFSFTVPFHNIPADGSNLEYFTGCNNSYGSFTFINRSTTINNYFYYRHDATLGVPN